MGFAVLAGGGQQLVDGNEDHDSCDDGEHAAHQRGRHERHEDRPGEQSPDGLGQAGEEREPERLSAVARGVEDGDGDGDTLGDVVDGDGDGNGDAQRAAVDGGGEGGDALGEVMDGDGERSENPHAHQPRMTRPPVHLLDAVGLVGILDRGHEPVDDADQEDAPEERDDAENHADPLAPRGRERLAGLAEQLDERHVNHHAARQTQRKGEQTLVGPPGQKRHGAADARSQAGSEREQKRNEKLRIHTNCVRDKDNANGTKNGARFRIL